MHRVRAPAADSTAGLVAAKPDLGSALPGAVQAWLLEEVEQRRPPVFAGWADDMVSYGPPQGAIEGRGDELDHAFSVTGTHPPACLPAAAS